MKLRVGIVGAGPGGLAAALAAHRFGLEARVFERAERFEKLGGGILIHSNGQQVLDALGLLEPFRESMRLSSRIVIESPPGRRRFVADYLDAKIPFPQAAVVLRHKLQQHLLDAVARRGIQLGYGSEVTGVENCSGGATVSFRARKAERFDVVIGADGIHSAVRCGVAPRARVVRLREAYLRGVATIQQDRDEIREMWGTDGRRFGICPLAGGETYFYCTAPWGGWERIRDHELKAWVAGWESFGDAVLKVLSAVSDWDRVTYDEITELKTSDWGRGRTILIGDAAHAMTPDLGQGANAAMVDAMVLGRLLAVAARTGRDSAEAAQEYEGIRKPFVRDLARASRTTSLIAGLRFSPLRAVRDALLSMCYPVRLRSRMLRTTAGYNPSEQRFLEPGQDI